MLYLVYFSWFICVFSYACWCVKTSLCINSIWKGFKSDLKWPCSAWAFSQERRCPVWTPVHFPVCTSLDCLDWGLWTFPRLGGLSLEFSFDGKYHDGVTGTCGATGCCRLAPSPEETEAQTEGRVFESLCAGVLSPGVIGISARLQFFNSQQKLTKAGLPPQVNPVLCTFKVPN